MNDCCCEIQEIILSNIRVKVERQKDRIKELKTRIEVLEMIKEK